MGEADGRNLNLPLKTGSSVEEYLAKLDIGLDGIQQVDPEFLVVSLGFDTFHLDPLGKFEIETEDYERIAKVIRAKLKGVRRNLILLEGGYVVEKLGGCLLSFLRGWEEWS